MPWCNFCHNFVFGLRLQGFKCKGNTNINPLSVMGCSNIDCGYIAHKQCKECAPEDCTPSKQHVKRSK